MYLKILGLLLLIKNVICANILAIMVVPSHSHHLFSSIYLEALATRGHNITYLGIDEYKNPPKNIRHLLIRNVYEKLHAGLSDFSALAEMSTYESVMSINGWEDLTRNTLKDTPEIKNLVEIVKKEKFDLVAYDIGGSPFLLGAAHVLKAPVIGVTAFGIPTQAYEIIGNPVSYAINPHFLSSYGEDMNLFQRMDNFILYMLSFIQRRVLLERELEVSKELFGKDVDLQEVLNGINVLLVNANSATDPPIPTLPGLIPIGGLNIKEPKSLPKDIHSYLDDAKEGVIYFSLGTNIPNSMLRKEILDVLIDAFKRLSPLKVLWKYEKDDLPGKPDNVKISKWLPQNDILAHPNVRIFFTHSGMLSTHEAIYHGVPIVALPFFLDQHTNADKCVRYGLGEKLNVKSLTVEKVVGTIRKIIDDPKYKQQALKLSSIFRDYPDKPIDRAVYWTEYVIRHNGAPHLRSASRNLFWYQNNLLDVFLIFFAVISTVIIIIYKFLTLFIKKIIRAKEKTQ